MIVEIKCFTLYQSVPLSKSKEMMKSRKLFLPLRYAMMFAVPG